MDIRFSKYLALSFVFIGATAEAEENFSDIFTEGHIGGQVRLYNFNRIYEGHAQKKNQHATSASLLLDANSGSFYGFSIGGSLAGVSDLGTEDDNPDRVDTTLQGDRSSWAAITQAYLQYKRDWLTLKGGYQYLDTPWMSRSDSRMVPASYTAVTAVITPVKDWNITLLREFAFRGRTASSYQRDNLYYPSGYENTHNFGGNNKLPDSTKEANGTYAIGTNYTIGGLKAQGWFYDFQNFGRLSYFDGSYTYNTGTGFNPVLGAQYTHETTGTHNYLTGSTASVNTRKGGRKVKADAWGLDAGLIIPNGRIDMYYNKLEASHSAVGGGAIVSPFTVGYATDPLYTTSMIRGLVEMGPGDAWKAKFTYNMLQNKLNFTTSYAEYNTTYYGTSHNVYADLTYNFGGALKGLSVRDRWERSSGGKNNLNPGNNAFMYNRVMVSYAF